MAVPGTSQAQTRLALTDIGNLVTPRLLDGKPLLAITTSVTENAQIHTNKKAKVNIATVTPVELEERNKPESYITERNKGACALKEKPKQINIVDTDYELTEVDYVEDIYKFYKLVENESKVDDYMHLQSEINEKMRANLIDWLNEVHNKFELMNETLYLTINIIDRFLSFENIARGELQCVGMSAMLIASKYEDIWPPQVTDFVQISNEPYECKQILVMEKRILGRLEWNLTVPTPYVFLNLFINAAASLPESTMEMKNMVYFYAELGMMNYEIIRFSPSMVAAAAVYAARATLNKSHVWHETLEMQTGFNETQVLECAKMMAVFHEVVKDDEKPKMVYKKYTSETCSAVALYSPAKSLLAGAI